jgi:hypothetical protein
MKDPIERRDAIDAIKAVPDGNWSSKRYVTAIKDLPPAQPDSDWDYSEETKQITLIVPEDVYNSAETIFLSVGYEGTFGIRGMVYSAQPERKKGRWVPIICTSDGKHHEWCGHQCSICGERTLRLMHHNFCPNCGNDMREG